MTYSEDIYWDAWHRNNVHLWFYLPLPFGKRLVSRTWFNATALAEHFRNIGGFWPVEKMWLGNRDSQRWVGTLPSTVIPGDVIFANWNDGDLTQIKHAGVLVKYHGEWVIAQHTENRYNTFTDWKDWHETGGGSTYVWIVQPNEG
jgi:hypothetical protein